MNTPSAYKHEYAWLTSSSKYFVFELRACKDAYIALTETPHVTTDGAYELVIGGSGNTKQVLYAAAQRQTAATAYFSSKQFLLFAIALQYTYVHWQTGVTACFANKGLCQVEKIQKSEKNSKVCGWVKPQLGFFRGGNVVFFMFFLLFF